MVISKLVISKQNMKKVRRMYLEMDTQALIKEFYAGLLSVAYATESLSHNGSESPGKASMIKLEKAVELASTAQTLFEKGSGGLVYLLKSGEVLGEYVASYPALDRMLGTEIKAVPICTRIANERGFVPPASQIKSDALEDVYKIMERIRNPHQEVRPS